MAQEPVERCSAMLKLMLAETLREASRGIGTPGTEQHAAPIEIRDGPKLPGKGETDEHLSSSGSREGVLHTHPHIVRFGRPHSHPFELVYVHLNRAAADNIDRPSSRLP